ncbi:MAG: hypothetical protein IPL92_12560 [Saprospiraceae bacterium]|nr:hypothetical protein [Candidatus Opimibacter iunctus]
MKSVFCIVSILFIALQGRAQDVTFPRELTNSGSTLSFYQPQVDSWVDFKKLVYRAAIALTPYQGEEILGVIYMESATDVNTDNHQVLVYNMTIQKTHFPTLDATTAGKMDALVRAFLTPDRSILMSLEQIVACTPKNEPVNTIAVNNTPPVIFVTTKPTILIQSDGPPVKSATNKENLEYVVNVNYPIFFDAPNTAYFLYDGLEWQKGERLSGPWTFTSTLPKSLISLAKDTSWAYLKECIPAASKPSANMPQVYYSEKLAELILFDGEPIYSTIKGTNLTYATNSYSDFFYCSTDKKYYYVTAGRWFKSSSLNGPWTFATPDLPADFLKIPDDSPASSILPFVPGSEQAKDAVMIAQIPTTIEVNATEAAKMVNIVYSGEPKFEPIDSTTLFYAVNTSDKVIKVSSNQYYACVQGIWFLSSTPTGPWQTATSVPEAIYTMPASSPVYNVTYVTQNVTVNNTVQATYTSGYMGLYVVAAPTGVIIISGTGYYHPPYYYYPPYGYPVYYPYPVTYGVYAYHPYPYGGVAYHASYNPNTGMYARSATAYSPYGTATVAQGYNPYTGTYARGASVSTPYGSRSSAQAYNPYTGTAASTHQGSSPYAQWGTSTVSRNGQQASAAHVTTNQGTAAGVKTASGDKYATANGNVYKNTGNGWEDASRPPQTQPAQNNAMSNKQAPAQQPATNATRPASSQPVNTQEMDRDFQNRQRSATQTQQFSGRTSGFSGGGARQMPAGGGRRG